MDYTLPQPIHARPPQRRRSTSGPICVGLLLALLAGGLGLAARTALQDSPPTGTLDEVARLARVYQGASPCRSLQEILAHPDLIPTHDHPLVGRQAPDFALADAEGKARDLKELRGGEPVVLIFYYGYHCDHCVRQLFDINRDLPLFREVGARVVAISADPPELTARRFQHYGPFGFPVLSDPGNKVAHAYEVFRADQLRHGTFLLDRKGTVQWVNVGDAPFRRNPALLSQLARMAGRFASAQPSQ